MWHLLAVACGGIVPAGTWVSHKYLVESEEQEEYSGQHTDISVSCLSYMFYHRVHLRQITEIKNKIAMSLDS